MQVDTTQWKIASFKIKEKLWDEFVTAAHQNGETVNHVMASAIERYIAGQDPLSHSSKSIDTASSARTPASPPDLSGIHVLILDDEVNIRTSISSILEHFGATVTAMSSPIAAIEALQANPHIYHAILSDIGMPEQDGWSFIRQVRALSPEAGGKIPAAALTSYSSPREIDIAKRLGFQVHIAKPIDASRLAEIVANLVRK
jgi:two-component system, chemotaxis family, CheB/CheR fusion protein